MNSASPAVRVDDAPEPILRETDADGVRTLTLCRPAQRNALSFDLMGVLIDALARVAQDRTIRVVVLAAEGPVFCAGHDLKEIRANPDRAFHEMLFARCSDLMLAIQNLPQPVIARVHGMATAAGCQLVATCDLAIAVVTAKFATPGVNIGLFCSTPMVALTRAIGRKAAMGMLLTGQAIDAGEAVRLGLINQAVPADQLDASVATLAATIASKSPLTLKTGKEAFYRQAEMPTAAAYDYAAKVMVENMTFRDAEEGIDAFIAKRAPVWTGR